MTDPQMVVEESPATSTTADVEPHDGCCCNVCWKAAKSAASPSKIRSPWESLKQSADTFSVQGDWNLQQGRVEDAQSYYQQALRFLQRAEGMLADDTSTSDTKDTSKIRSGDKASGVRWSPSSRRNLTPLRYRLGSLYTKLGKLHSLHRHDPNQAYSYYQQALQVQQRLWQQHMATHQEYRRDNTTTELDQLQQHEQCSDFLWEFANTLYRVGTLTEEVGEKMQAQTYLEEALEIAQQAHTIYSERDNIPVHVAKFLFYLHSHLGVLLSANHPIAALGHFQTATLLQPKTISITSTATTIETTEDTATTLTPTSSTGESRVDAGGRVVPQRRDEESREEGHPSPSSSGSDEDSIASHATPATSNVSSSPRRPILDIQSPPGEVKILPSQYASLIQKARLYHTEGKVALHMGKYDLAQELLTKALDIYSRMYHEVKDQARRNKVVVRMHEYPNVEQYAVLLRHAGTACRVHPADDPNLDQAQRYLMVSLEILTELAEEAEDNDKSNNHNLGHDMAKILYELARVFHDQRRYQRAKSYYTRALQIYEFELDHEDLAVRSGGSSTSLRIERAQILYHLGRATRQEQTVELNDNDNIARVDVSALRASCEYQERALELAMPQALALGYASMEEFRNTATSSSSRSSFAMVHPLVHAIQQELLLMSNYASIWAISRKAAPE